MKIWKKIFSFIKRKLYLRKYKNFDYFFEKYKRKFEEARIEYTTEDIQEYAKREYSKFKNKIYIVGIIISILLTLIGGLEVSIGITDKIASYVVSVLALFSKDAWLGFLGNVIGSIVAIFGLYTTISFERKKDEKETKEKVKPIIILTGKQNEKENSDNIYQIHLSKYGAHSDETEIIEYSEYVVRNLGYPAINFEISAEINNVLYSPNKFINYIPASDYVIIKIFLEIPRYNLSELFKSKSPENSFIIRYSDIKGTLYNDTYKGFVSFEKDGEDSYKTTMNVLI